MVENKYEIQILNKYCSTSSKTMSSLLDRHPLRLYPPLPVCVKEAQPHHPTP